MTLIRPTGCDVLTELKCSWRRKGMLNDGLRDISIDVIYDRIPYGDPRLGESLKLFIYDFPY